MTKNNFRYHITINYDKSSSACIDLSHVVAKKNNKIATKLCAPATNWENELQKSDQWEEWI